jgi:hypothetical protein
MRHHDYFMRDGRNRPPKIAKISKMAIFGDRSEACCGSLTENRLGSPALVSTAAFG